MLLSIARLILPAGSILGPFSCCWAVADEYTPRSGECNQVELKKQSEKKMKEPPHSRSTKSTYNNTYYMYVYIYLLIREFWLKNNKTFSFIFFLFSYRIKCASHSNFRFSYSERSVRLVLVIIHIVETKTEKGGKKEKEKEEWRSDGIEIRFL